MRGEVIRVKIFPHENSHERDKSDTFDRGKQHSNYWPVSSQTKQPPRKAERLPKCFVQEEIYSINHLQGEGTVHPPIAQMGHEARFAVGKTWCELGDMWNDCFDRCEYTTPTHYVKTASCYSDQDLPPPQYHIFHQTHMNMCTRGPTAWARERSQP